MNLLEKYYLQGKGKLMVGIFVLVVLSSIFGSINNITNLNLCSKMNKTLVHSNSTFFFWSCSTGGRTSCPLSGTASAITVTCCSYTHRYVILYRYNALCIYIRSGNLRCDYCSSLASCNDLSITVYCCYSSFAGLPYNLFRTAVRNSGF